MKVTSIGAALVVAVPFILAQQPVTSAPQKSISSYMGLHTFPAKNQTAAQQQQDEMACYEWSKKDSGFDPLAVLSAQQQPPAAESAKPAAHETQGAGAKEAVTGTAPSGPAVSCNATAPPAPPLPGSVETDPAPSFPPPLSPACAIQAVQKLDGFKKGFSACMEAKNYVVK